MNQWETTDERPIIIRGVELVCMHCGDARFEERSLLLNTRGMTYFGMDWLNEGARVFECKSCGFLHWFTRLARFLDGSSPAECASCDAAIPPGVERCEACGWTYKVEPQDPIG